VRFVIEKCPECGENPSGIVQVIPCMASITRQGDGSFDFAGESDVWWDDQRTDIYEEMGQAEGEGTVSLGCKNSHRWDSKYTDLD